MNKYIDNKPGRPRRCPPCPVCGEDAMTQRVATHSAFVDCYFYACSNCQWTDVWREDRDQAGSVIKGRWVKQKEKAESYRNTQTTP